MKKRHVALGAALAVAGILAMGATYTKSGPEGGPGRFARFANRPLGKLIMGNMGRAMTLRSELNVTDEQKEKIKTIVEKRRPEAAPLIKGVVENRRALRKAVLADSPSEAAIRKAAEDLGKAMGDAAILASKAAGDVKTVLTPEQIEKFKKFAADCDGAVDNWAAEVGREK